MSKMTFSNYIYKNDLDKACFAHDAAYSDSKGLDKKTISDRILKDTAYEIAMNPKCDDYQRGLASMMHKFFDKKTRLRTTVNEELAQELNKPVIENPKEGKTTSGLKMIFVQRI